MSHIILTVILIVYVGILSQKLTRSGSGLSSSPDKRQKNEYLSLQTQLVRFLVFHIFQSGLNLRFLLNPPLNDYKHLIEN